MSDDRRRAVIREVGALLGTSDPDAFADWILAPPCQHYGEWEFDDTEICPEPCGLKHEWCVACGRPMKPACPIVDPEEEGLPDKEWA